MNKDKVSIIIPIYNAEKHIDKCIKSLCNQTYKNIEIIAVNDGSTDNTLNILNKYKDKITIINQKNQRVCKARNNGIKKATGKYIMFCDADDWYDKNTVEVAVKNIGDFDLLKYCEKRAFKDGTFTKMIDKIEFKEYYGKDVYKLLEGFFTYKCFAHIMTFIFKRDIIIKNNILFDANLRYCEDTDFLRQYIDNTSSFKAIEVYLYNYYENVDSFTNDYNSIIKNLASLGIFYDKTKKALPKEMNYTFEQSLLILILLNVEKLRSYKNNKITKIYKEVCIALDGFFDNLPTKDKGIKWKIFAFIIKNKWYRVLNLYVSLYLKLR